MAPLPPSPSFLTRNPAYLRVTQASAGRTVTANNLPPFSNVFPFPGSFYVKFTAGSKKPHVLQKHIVWFFYGLALTESLCSSKPPEGTGCCCMGDLYYSGSKTSQPHISAFFEEMQLSSERKEFSSTEGQSNIFCAQGKVLLSAWQIVFWDRSSLDIWGMGWGAVFHAAHLESNKPRVSLASQ